MFKYVCKRLLQSMVTLVIVATTVFLLLRLMPEEGYFAETKWMKRRSRQP